MTLNKMTLFNNLLLMQYTHNGTLFIYKKEINPAIGKYMNGP